MLIRLALKELRETAWIAGVALVVWIYLVMVTTGIGFGTGTLSSLFTHYFGDDTIHLVIIVGLCLAIGLGLRQTSFENANGTFQFLLNRPISRKQLIGIKLLVGTGLYLIVAACPLLLIGWWGTTPGNIPAPFEWSMLASALKAWPAMTILYLGAFLAGLRPGRWHVTRLLPLVACGFLAIVIINLPLWWAIGAPAILLLNLLLVTNIFFIAETRDYS